MLFLAGCWLAHAMFAGLIPSPWWVPDLTLAGLVLAVGRRPARWLILSGAAGLFTIIWAVRFPLQILVGYLVIGGIVRALTRAWDATDVRVQSLMAGIASVAMTFGALWLDGLWSIAQLGLALVHAAVTALAVPVIQRTLRARRWGLHS